MKGVLLSGGRGTRLRPITHTGPKQLVPIANRPVIEYAIEDLHEAGISEIGVVLGEYGHEDVQEFLGDGSRFGVDITYILQGKPLGIAHAVGCARDFVGRDDFVVYLGDNILKQGISELVCEFLEGDNAAGIALQRVEDPSEFGIAEIAPGGDIRRLVEKPKEPRSDLALIGIYAFSPHVFDVIERLEPSSRGELEITEAIQGLLEDGFAVNSHVVEGWWKDTGKPEDILSANRLILEDHPGDVVGTIEDGAEVSGRVDLKENAVIRSGAVVRGPVSIGERSTVRDGAYVGPYTSIGADTSIKHTHVENSVIVGNSSISASGRIVDSLIGKHSTIESSHELIPEGRRLVIGENSKLKL